MTILVIINNTGVWFLNLIFAYEMNSYTESPQQLQADWPKSCGIQGFGYHKSWSPGYKYINLINSNQIISYVVPLSGTEGCQLRVT